jgi:hypothetical protein
VKGRALSLDLVCCGVNQWAIIGETSNAQ